jgi:hypothetical protein
MAIFSGTLSQGLWDHRAIRGRTSSAHGGAEACGYHERTVVRARALFAQGALLLHQASVRTLGHAPASTTPSTPLVSSRQRRWSRRRP